MNRWARDGRRGGFGPDRRFAGRDFDRGGPGPRGGFAGGPGGRGPSRPGFGPQGGPQITQIARRLNALEDKIDALIREVRRTSDGPRRDR
jgi:hypothetical protein